MHCQKGKRAFHSQSLDLQLKPIFLDFEVVAQPICHDLFYIVNFAYCT